MLKGGLTISKNVKKLIERLSNEELLDLKDKLNSAGDVVSTEPGELLSVLSLFFEDKSIPKDIAIPGILILIFGLMLNLELVMGIGAVLSFLGFFYFLLSFVQLYHYLL